MKKCICLLTRIPAMLFACCVSVALMANIAPQSWEVKDHNGAPGLFRNGTPVPPLFFWQWELQEPDVWEMSRQGFDLFAMFGSFPHYKHPYWRADGSFDTAYYDAQFDAALRWNPSAQLLPRLFVTAPDWWSELNTNEQFVAEVPSGVKVSWEHLPRESFASVKAREEVAPYYRRLVRHLIGKYGRNLLGVHVTNGPWGEDFSWDAYFLQKFRPAAGDQSEPMRRAFEQYLRTKYGNDVSRLRAAFKDPAATFENVKVPTKAERLRVNADGWRDPAEGRKVVDYFECHNRVTVDMLDYWCSLVKEESGGKLATLVFYGYTQDERWPVECDHRAISELYLRPSVDMLSAPHTYHRRDLGGDGEMRQYLASAALHGKLFVDEGDDMSHLERLKPHPDRRAHAQTIDDSLALFYREFGNTITHGVGLWYMDLKKDTFRDPRLYDACGRMRKWSQESLKHDRSHISEVAVVSSVESEYYLAYRNVPGHDHLNPCTDLYLKQMGEFYRAGAPFDWYLVEDIDAVLARNYKTVVFLDCQYLSDEHYAKIQKLKGNGRSLVWFHAPGYVSQTGLSAARMKALCGFDYGTTNIVARDFGNHYGVFSPGAGLKADRLREIYRRSGVHIYTDSDVVLSCNKSWLMLHTARGMDCTVRLPQKAARILEVTTETPVAENTDTFIWHLPDRSTAVFLLEQHRDLIGYRRCIPMEGFLRTDPGLRQIGLFRTRESSEIASSRWSVGCECLDREFADFKAYAKYLGKTGAKHARLFSGWAKTEKEKGKYDFAWLDAQIRHAASVGVKPWICLSYGNPVYKSGRDIGTGVASVVGNPEAFEGWLRYCGEVVKRYGDVVDEWEIWNEPFGKQMEDYFKMVVKTSEAIHAIQPRAKVMVSAVGTVENAKELLGIFVREGRADAVQSWHVHPYIPNPDKASDPWWGLDSVDEFRALLAKANPNIRLVQGETGCPSQLEYTHALSMRPWTEYSQAKWELRSMANYAVRGIPYSVFAMVDNQYYDMLQSFGLLRANLKKGVVYARPKYFACRNMFSFFDDGVKPVGSVQADFQVLESRMPQFDPPSCDRPSTNDVPRQVAVVRFEKAGTPVLLVWYAHRIPSDALVFDTVRFSTPGVAFRDPVWMDMITGRVYEIDAKDFETRNGTTVFTRLPLWDSPILLAERGQVELSASSF